MELLHIKYLYAYVCQKYVQKEKYISYAFVHMHTRYTVNKYYSWWKLWRKKTGQVQYFKCKEYLNDWELDLVWITVHTVKWTTQFWLIWTEDIKIIRNVCTKWTKLHWSNHNRFRVVVRWKSWLGSHWIGVWHRFEQIVNWLTIAELYCYIVE
jgi:hypothetical protein